MPGPNFMDPDNLEMEESEPCPRCDGVGTIYLGQPQQCSECGGTGTVGSADEVAADEFESEEEAMDDSCPECGAAGEEPCDPACPNAEEEGVDPDTAWDSRIDKKPVGESVNFNFDKFTDRILLESQKRGIRVMNDSPLRSRAATYQERPMGKTRIGGK